MIAGRGDDLPVSAMPVDGTFPTGTAMWEKRNIAQQIPVWDEQLCIQCGKCVLVCPACSHPRQGLRRLAAGERAGRVQVGKAALAGIRESDVHAPGFSGRLHRVRALRRGLSGKEQERG